MARLGLILLLGGILLMLAAFIIGFGPQDVNAAIGKYVEFAGIFSLLPITIGGALIAVASIKKARGSQTSSGAPKDVEMEPTRKAVPSETIQGVCADPDEHPHK